MIQFVTFRLADSLPAAVAERLATEMAEHQERRDPIDPETEWEDALDAGHGSCLLRDPGCASIVEGSLRHHDGSTYALHAWCVMPNHVHVLLATLAERRLPEVLRSIKRFTAGAINTHLGRTGGVWRRDYFDRFIRDDAHYRATVAYIHRNPVAAGLVSSPEQWPH